MSIYNNKHVVFEQVGVDSDTVVLNQSTNTDGDGAYNNYEISNIRNTVLPTKALALSSELYATLTNTTVQTAKNGNANICVSTSDKTFILAEREMTSTRLYSRSVEFDRLTTLDWYVSHTQSTDRIKYDTENVSRYYWLRSPNSGYTNSVVYIGYNGSFFDNSAGGSYRVSQCFAY